MDPVVTQTQSDTVVWAAAAWPEDPNSEDLYFSPFSIAIFFKGEVPLSFWARAKK